MERTFRDGYAVHITTNAMLLHKLPGFIDYFRDKRISAKISIDGYGQTYDGIRKRASWDRLVTNLLGVIRARMEGSNEHSVISVNYQLMRRTLADLPRFVEFCADEGVDVLQLSYTEIYDKMVRRGEITEDESVFRHQSETNEAVERAREIARREGVALSAPAPLGQTALIGLQWTGNPILTPQPPGSDIVPRTTPCRTPRTEFGCFRTELWCHVAVDRRKVQLSVRWQTDYRMPGLVRD